MVELNWEIIGRIVGWLGVVAGSTIIPYLTLRVQQRRELKKTDDDKKRTIDELTATARRDLDVAQQQFVAGLQGREKALIDRVDDLEKKNSELWKKITELQERNYQLEQKNSQCEQRVNSLSERLRRIEARPGYSLDSDYEDQ